MSVFLFRNKLLILGIEDYSCLLWAVYLTATKVPASVKTQLLDFTFCPISSETELDIVIIKKKSISPSAVVLICAST